MAKKKTLEDRYFPVATIPRLNQPAKPAENPTVIKKIIQGAIQGAYQRKIPSDYDLKYGNVPKEIVSKEEIELVINLIESLQPIDAIEVALASQFAVTYIRGLEKSKGGYPIDLTSTLQLFEFGHQVLEALQKYRTKGAQLIQVQYNHNQGQINNFKVVEKDNPQPIIEVN